MTEPAADPAWKSNTAFDSNGIQRAWDSTSLSAFKACPRKYQLSIREALRPIERSPDLTWGILIHKTSEAYHIARAQGAGHEEAVRAGIAEVFDTSWTPELLRTGERKKSRSTLLRAAVWYLDWLENDPLETVILSNGKPATELSFRMQLPATTPSGEPYLLCGHIDRLARDASGTYVVDIKSTKSTLSSYFFRKFNPHNQMSLYTIGAKVLYTDKMQGVMIDGVQAAVGFNRFIRAEALRHQEQLEEWLSDTIWWIKLAERLAQERGDAPWPQNESACHTYGICPFAEPICTERSIHRPAQVRMNFERRIWDPLKSREV